jgi:hypothetical protein
MKGIVSTHGEVKRWTFGWFRPIGHAPRKRGIQYTLMSVFYRSIGDYRIARFRG